eukprot:gene15862-20271_t
MGLGLVQQPVEWLLFSDFSVVLGFVNAPIFDQDYVDRARIQMQADGWSADEVQQARFVVRDEERGGPSTDLILRSAPQGRVSKDGQRTRCAFPCFETLSRGPLLSMRPSGLHRPRQVEPDAAQVPERPVQPLDHRGGERRPQDRLDVGLHVRPVAGAEQDDV